MAKTIQTISPQHQTKDMQKIMHVFSHDLRNPLLNIQALMQEMNMTIQDAKDAQATGNAQALGEVLQQDLPDVLAMLEESTGRLDAKISGINAIYHCMYDTLECEAIDMTHLVQRCFAKLDLAQAGVELRCADLPMVYADPLVVQRLLCALLENAAQAIAKQPKQKTIVIAGQQDAEMVVFSMRDDGCGLVTSEMDRLFEPFFSGQQFADRDGQGLAMVKAWVERHGGAVDAIWHEEGTELCWTLPKVG